MDKKALIAMSGGVDSTVAALLCQKAGYNCEGVTMRLFDNEQCDKPCGTDENIKDAAAVSDALGFPHRVFDLREEFKNKIISRFIEVYEAGGTPNPCIECNRRIKFGKLIEMALRAGFDYVATGHYAAIEEKNGRYHLKRAADRDKDQSYVLYSLTQHQLAHTLLPLGGYSKPEIRAIAEENGLKTAGKKDSQDICFVPDGDYAAFIEEFSGRSYPEGDFVDRDGKRLGTHKGIIRYTIGQRRGLGLALPAPMYVCEKDIPNNRVVLCSNEELFTRELTVGDFNWIAFDTPPSSLRASVKVRYAHKEQPADITLLGDGKVRIVFDEPQRAIAKGQAAVLYDGDYVLGGGTIL